MPPAWPASPAPPGSRRSAPRSAPRPCGDCPRRTRTPARCRRGILAQPAHERRVLAGGVDWRDVSAILAGIHELHPRGVAQHKAGVATDTGCSNSTCTASAWPMNTGTRTQVATSLMSGSRILRISTDIFHSSLVNPSSMKLSICGITLKAIGLVNCSATNGSLTKLPSSDGTIRPILPSRRPTRFDRWRRRRA